MNAALTTDGCTSLTGACGKGHLDVIRELCERGANVNAARTTDGFTALMRASQNGFIAVVKYLLDHGADKAALNTSGENAFSFAGKKIVADLRDLLKP